MKRHHRKNQENKTALKKRSTKKKQAAQRPTLQPVPGSLARLIQVYSAVSVEIWHPVKYKEITVFFTEKRLTIKIYIDIMQA